MATTREDIERWWDQGIKDNDSYMIVVCDTYDWDDYPVYVKTDKAETVYNIAKSYHCHNMQKVMEIYHLKGDKEKQIRMSRAFAVDGPWNGKG